MATKIQHRRDTAANWTSNNPVLAPGEVGFETDTALYKIGNGLNTWSVLSYPTVAAQGTSGIIGAQGAQGLQGNNGTSGASGSSAYWSFNLNTQRTTATTYYLQPTDAFGVLEIGNTMNSYTTVYLPYSTQTIIPVGSIFKIFRTDFGSTQSVYIQAAQAGVLVQSTTSSQQRPQLRAQYSHAFVQKIDTDRWFVSGDLI